jgi:hypothetical protein
MKTFNATVIALVILYVLDQFISDGRHTTVVTGLLRQVGWFVGVHA